MNINSVLSNPILNNPTFNKTQTRELPADQNQEMTTLDEQQTQSTASNTLPEDNVSLSSTSQAQRTDSTRSTRSSLSAVDAEQMASALKQMMSSNPSQAMQAIGTPDNRMVQSLLSVA